MTIDEIINETDFLRDWSILTAYRGSKTHGTYRPSDDPASVDDIDVMAVVVPTADHYYALRKLGRQGTRTIMRGEWDIVLHECKKSIRMSAGCNPNVLPLLWLRPEDYIRVCAAGKEIINHREIFLTQALYKPFVCYAANQLRQMERVNFEGYMGAKRKALVEKFGYDIKMASHTIRLLRMAAEALEEGVLRVFRPDAEELLEIKTGKWSKQDVIAEAERLFPICKQALADSSLPPNPDMDAVNELCVQVVRSALDGEGRGRE